MRDQFLNRPAWQCQKCRAIFLTELGMRRHAEKCNYQEPELEGQVSLYEQVGKRDQGDSFHKAAIEI